MAHSPLPWKAVGSQHICDPGDNYLAVLYFRDGQAQEDRDLILRAVNSHETLVRACQLALVKLGGPSWLYGQAGNSCGAIDEARGLLRGALESVKESPGG